MNASGSPLHWGLFALVIVAVMAVDLGMLNRDAHKISVRAGAVWTCVWVSLGLLFNAYVFHELGSQKAMQFTQAWLLEYALSIDNVFVFIVIFNHFRVPEAYQHRVLFWGIIGAVITRGAFVFAGAAFIARFDWVMYLLGAFLVVTAFKLLLGADDAVDPERSRVLRLFRRFVPCRPGYHGAAFVTRAGGRLVATPLLAVLVVVEATDVVFAVDSIPACFGVTTDVFIVYTSNIFAILGLRSLFFLIAGLMSALRYLKAGVALILGFIGVKILLADLWHPPAAVSLGVLATILATCTVASLFGRPSPEPAGD